MQQFKLLTTLFKLRKLTALYVVGEFAFKIFRKNKARQSRKASKSKD